MHAIRASACQPLGVLARSRRESLHAGGHVGQDRLLCEQDCSSNGPESMQAQYFKGAAGSLRCALLCRTLKVACFPMGNGSGTNGSCACKRAQRCCEWQVRGAGRVVDLAADQDSTDLQKCLICASRMIAADPARFSDARILALGAYCNFC